MKYRATRSKWKVTSGYVTLVSIQDVERKLENRTKRWARGRGHTETAGWLGRGLAEG